jgi:hypothetical protein
MIDTTQKIAALVAERHARMSPEERLQIASQMFETARGIVESSLPEGLSRRNRRLALARRLYQGELPEAALNAFADWTAD